MDFILPVGDPVEFFVFVLVPGILFQVMVKLFKPNFISEWSWYQKLDELSIFGNKTAGELLDKLLVISLIGLVLNFISFITFILIFLVTQEVIKFVILLIFLIFLYFFYKIIPVIIDVI